MLACARGDVCFSAAKLFFAYGLGNALTFPMSVGATTLLMGERPTPDATFKRWTGGVAARRADRVLRRAHRASPACWRRPACRREERRGAAPGVVGRRSAAGRHRRAFQAHFGVDIVDGIGSTEMLHIFISNRPGPRALRQHRLAGAGLRIELRGDGGSPVPDGEPGDLYTSTGPARR